MRRPDLKSIEILERRYPGEWNELINAHSNLSTFISYVLMLLLNVHHVSLVLLRRFGLREGSGGNGKHKGGNGVIREIEPLRPLVMSILSERRTLQPYGLNGGEPGMTGKNQLVKKDGVILNIGAKRSGSLNVGERLVIETPGGGGYGSAE